MRRFKAVRFPFVFPSVFEPGTPERTNERTNEGSSTPDLPDLPARRLIRETLNGRP